jgi:hypothetical protein
MKLLEKLKTGILDFFNRDYMIGSLKLTIVMNALFILVGIVLAIIIYKITFLETIIVCGLLALFATIFSAIIVFIFVPFLIWIVTSND